MVNNPDLPLEDLQGQHLPQGLHGLSWRIDLIATCAGAWVM